MTRQLMKAGTFMAACVLSMAGAGVQAQKTGTLSAADKKFVMDAAHGGVAEVKMGELAAKQGSSEGVKQFGQKMVEDHSKANEELKTVATAKGITLPTEPNAEQKATMVRLMKLHGAALTALTSRR